MASHNFVHFAPGGGKTKWDGSREHHLRGNDGTMPSLKLPGSISMISPWSKALCHSVLKCLLNEIILSRREYEHLRDRLQVSSVTTQTRGVAEIKFYGCLNNF